MSKDDIKKNEVKKDEKVQEKALAYGKAVSIDPAGDTMGKRVNVNVFFQTHRQNADIFGCIREIYQNVGKKGYSWVDENSEKILNPITEELDQIMNRFQSFRELKRDTLKDKKICGNAFWYLVRNFAGNRVVGIKRIDPRMMAIVLDKYGNIMKYLQFAQSGGSYDYEMFEPSEIVHFTGEKDPDFPMYGLSPIEPMFWEVQTDLKAITSNYVFFENMAMPAVQYILDEKLNKKAAEEVIASIKSQFGGAANKHKSGILKGVKEVKTISANKQEMDFLNGRAFTTEKICATYGVPKFMLGYTDSVNNNNGDNLTLNFIENTIIPEELEFEEVINEKMLYRLGLGETGIKFEFNQQKTQDSGVVEERARKEYEQGILTLRQYKLKTGQEISEDDEKNPLIDKHIIISGGSAVLSESLTQPKTEE